MTTTLLFVALTQWASVQPDVVGVALVGSYARDAATQESDVDIMVLTTNVKDYFRNKNWASQFGLVKKTEVERWGKVETLRAFYEDGRELEFNFSAPDWAGIPVDPGTHRVVSDGMLILLDSQGILKALQQKVLGS